MTSYYIIEDPKEFLAFGILYQDDWTFIGILVGSGFPAFPFMDCFSAIKHFSSVVSY